MYKLIPTFLIALSLQACAYTETQAQEARTQEWCSGYKRQLLFQTEIPLGGIHRNKDITGDGKPDYLRYWGKFGIALEINCGDGTSYVPIYSRTGFAAPPSKEGQWSVIGLWPISLEDRERDYFTWIDGKLHLFDVLPFVTEKHGKFWDAKDLPIYFDGDHYTTDFIYCEPFDIYAPLYKVGPPDPAMYIPYLELVFKSKTYRMNSKIQIGYNFYFFESLAINDDNIKDGKLVWQETGGYIKPEVRATFLGCGNDTYLYAPDHQVEKLIERGKQVAEKI